MSLLCGRYQKGSRAQPETTIEHYRGVMQVKAAQVVATAAVATAALLSASCMAMHHHPQNTKEKVRTMPPCVQHTQHQ
jgi:hypothetical protein